MESGDIKFDILQTDLRVAELELESANTEEQVLSYSYRVRCAREACRTYAASQLSAAQADYWTKFLKPRL